MCLSQTVKGMMASMAPVLGYALDAGAAELPEQAAAFPGHRLAAVESVLSHRMEHLLPLMDPRVLRRAAKDLWNSCAGVSPARPLVIAQWTFRIALLCNEACNARVATLINLSAHTQYERHASRLGMPSLGQADAYV